jgi:hypothetical protein
MPLWLAMLAAPCKDESWSPASLAEKIALKNNFHQPEIDREIISTIEISAAEIGRTVREAIGQARTVFQRLPMHDAGKLFVDKTGGLVTDVEAILAGGEDIQAIEATEGGHGHPAPLLITHLLSGMWKRLDGTAATQLPVRLVEDLLIRIDHGIAA